MCPKRVVILIWPQPPSPLPSCNNISHVLTIALTSYHHPFLSSLVTVMLFRSKIVRRCLVVSRYCGINFSPLWPPPFNITVQQVRWLEHSIEMSASYFLSSSWVTDNLPLHLSTNPTSSEQVVKYSFLFLMALINLHNQSRDQPSHDWMVKRLFHNKNDIIVCPRAHKNRRLEEERVNFIKFETGRNLPQTVTCSVQLHVDRTHCS